jgi:hypothetical protein
MKNDMGIKYVNFLKIAIGLTFFLNASVVCFALPPPLLTFGSYYQQQQSQGTMDLYIRNYPEAMWFSKTGDYTTPLIGAYISMDSRYFQTTLEAGFGSKGEGGLLYKDDYTYSPNTTFNLAILAFMKYPFNFFDGGNLEISPLAGIRYNYWNDFKAVYPVAGIGVYLWFFNIEALYAFARWGEEPMALDPGKFINPGDLQGGFTGSHYGFTIRIGISFYMDLGWNELERIGNISFGNYGYFLSLRKGYDDE